MAKHYVTLGQEHAHRVNNVTVDCDCVVRFEANTHKEGRDRAFELFGDKFFTDYHGDQWNEEKQLKYYPRGYVDIDDQN